MLYFLLFCLSLDSKQLREASHNILDKFSKQRSKYLQALDLMKKAFLILSELQKELFVDSTDFFKALDYFRFQKYDLCIPIFTALIKRNERKLESTFLLAECWFLKKDYKKAAAIYNAVIHSKYNICDDNFIQIIKYSFLKLIDCFILLGQQKDAAAVIQRYVHRFPEERNSPDVQLFCKRYEIDLVLEQNDSFLEESDEEVSPVLSVINAKKK